ncbi:MAG: hypothetical protein ACYC4U_11410 [Pirellulaceae bacterium]
MWKDPNGREWSTAVTVSTVKRVKELADTLLTDAADTDLVDRLYGDVMLLANVLYAVCEPQARQREVTAEQFGELLAGDTIDRACESLMRDIIDFFPSGRREIVTRIHAAARRLETERVNLIRGKMTDEQLEQIIRRTVSQASEKIDTHLAALGGDSGKSPES